MNYNIVKVTEIIHYFVNFFFLVDKPVLNLQCQITINLTGFINFYHGVLDMTTKILDKPTFKLFRSPFCNYFFNKLNGYTEIWGQNQDEDAIYLPDGPMIADIEITTICDGPKGIPCPFCYKYRALTGLLMRSFLTS